MFFLQKIQSASELPVHPSHEDHKLNGLDKAYVGKCCLPCLHNSLKDTMQFMRSLVRNFLDSS
jgi:hypothetical protein